MSINKLILICILILVSRSFSQNANPTRPSASDNAYLTQPGYTELEIGYLRTIGNFYSLPTLLKFSFHSKLEAGFFTSGIIVYDGIETKTGDPGIQLKYQSYNSDFIALSFVAKIVTIKNSSPQYTIYAVPSIQTSIAQIDVTLGTSFIKNFAKYDNSFFYATTISPKISMPFGIYAEVFGESFAGMNRINFDFGVSYPVTTNFIIDAAYSVGLNNYANDWTLQLGLTKTLFKVF